MASLMPDYMPTLANFRDAWESADFPRYYLNTAIICVGILAVQVVTIVAGGLCLRPARFPGRDALFYLFLLQLMLVPVVLIVPNLRRSAQLGLYDTLLGVMAPYFASAFGTFLMRQAFEAIPRDSRSRADRRRAMVAAHSAHLLPLAKPGLIAFSIVSVTAHWNEFLWPLMVINSPDNRPLTVGLATFTRGAEGAQAWGVHRRRHLAGHARRCSSPSSLFQRRFVNSFMLSGLK